MARRPITPTSASRMAGMLRFAPAPDLADVIEQHWVVRWKRAAAPAVRHEVLPDPSVNLAVEPTGRLLYGVGSSRFLRELSGSGTVIGTKFRPGGFFPEAGASAFSPPTRRRPPRRWPASGPQPARR